VGEGNGIWIQIKGKQRASHMPFTRPASTATALFRDNLTSFINKGRPSETSSTSLFLQEQISAQDWINYSSRTVTFGEENAIRWLMNKYGQK
jgi:hypothetical protein